MYIYTQTYTNNICKIRTYTNNICKIRPDSTTPWHFSPAKFWLISWIHHMISRHLPPPTIPASPHLACWWSPSPGWHPPPGASRAGSPHAGSGRSAGPAPTTRLQRRRRCSDPSDRDVARTDPEASWGRSQKSPDTLSKPGKSVSFSDQGVCQKHWQGKPHTMCSHWTAGQL